MKFDRLAFDSNAAIDLLRQDRPSPAPFAEVSALVMPIFVLAELRLGFSRANLNEFLEYCGKNGRIAVTHNQRIRYTPNELAAVVRYRVALLVVIGHAPFPELARHFVNSSRRIETFVEMHEPPYIAKVYRATAFEMAKKPAAAGSVSLWYPA